MLVILFLCSLFINGLLICHRIFRKVHRLLFIVGSFLIGMLVTMTFLYIAANLLHGVQEALWLYFAVCSLIATGILYKRKLFLRKIRLIIFEKRDLILLLVFAGIFLLFKKSFSYNTDAGAFLISSNLYVDFGAHIPFIRSFSLGNNFPSEVPFFAHSGLQYHFLFNFTTAVLEVLGMRIDHAFNLLSTLSLTCVIIMLYLWGRFIGNSTKAGILTCLLFFFQSSLAFIAFFKEHGFSLSAVRHNNFYIGNFPFDSGLIAGFWNMNTYLNQRHLIFGLVAVLFISYLFTDKNILQIKRYVQVILGFLIGLLPLWHITAFVSINIILFIALLVDRQKRQQLLPVMITATFSSLPWLFMITNNAHSSPVLQPGFLIDLFHKPAQWFIFWIVNLGISLVTILLGVFYAPVGKKKFALVLLPLFLLPNILHVSGRHPFDDHKFFNIWIAFMNCYSAFFLVWLYKKKLLFKITSGLLLLLLIASGLINTFVIKNDVYASIQDYPKNRFLQWSIAHIDSKKVVLTNGEIYDPLSIIGKKLYLGRAQYVYVYGGDIDKRLLIKQKIYSSHDQNKIKKLLKENNISFVVIYKNHFAKNALPANPQFFKQFMHTLYEDKDAMVLSP